MTRRLDTLIWWGPRIAGLAVAAFFALFALDAFNGTSILEALPALAMHLIPSALVLGAVAIAWRFDGIGSIAFVALAMVYAVMVRGRLDWVVAISGPLVMVGVLFLLSWRRHSEY